VKTTTFGILINNSDQKLSNGRYLKNLEKFLKNISVFRTTNEPKLKRIRFFW